MLVSEGYTLSRERDFLQGQDSRQRDSRNIGVIILTYLNIFEAYPGH